MNRINIEINILDLPNEEFLKYISEVSKDVNTIYVNGVPLICELIRRDKLDLIKGLIELENSIGELNLNISGGIEMNAPLHYACILDKFHIAEFLLNEGADPNILDKWGWNPCMHLRNEYPYNLTKLFLEKGVDINQKSVHDKTLLRITCEYNFPRKVKFLLENGAILEYEDDGTPSCLVEIMKNHFNNFNEIFSIIFEYRTKRIKGVRKE